MLDHQCSQVPKPEELATGMYALVGAQCLSLLSNHPLPYIPGFGKK